MEVVPALAPDVVVSEGTRRVDQPGSIADEIPPICRGPVGALIQFAQDVSEVASGAMVRRRRRRASDDIERRAARAHVFVQMGELSSGRAALEAAEVAPGSQGTLQQLQNPVRRPPRPREPIPAHLLEHHPRDQFEFDEDKFLQNLRSARRGAAGGPSGMTSEHLRILLENVRDGHMFFLMGTALRKADGGVRGIVASDVVRRLVSRTITQTQSLRSSIF